MSSSIIVEEIRCICLQIFRIEWNSQNMIVCYRGLIFCPYLKNIHTGNGLISPKRPKIAQIPYMLQNTDFSSCSNLKMNGITGKSSKNWPKKWYGSLCLDVRFLRYWGLKASKKLKKVLTQHFSWFSNLHISQLLTILMFPYLIKFSLLFAMSPIL